MSNQPVISLAEYGTHWYVAISLSEFVRVERCLLRSRPHAAEESRDIRAAVQIRGRAAFFLALYREFQKGGLVIITTGTEHAGVVASLAMFVCLYMRKGHVAYCIRNVDQHLPLRPATQKWATIRGAIANRVRYATAVVADLRVFESDTQGTLWSAIAGRDETHFRFVGRFHSPDCEGREPADRQEASVVAPQKVMFCVPGSLDESRRNLGELDEALLMLPEKVRNSIVIKFLVPRPENPQSALTNLERSVQTIFPDARLSQREYVAHMQECRALISPLSSSLRRYGLLNGTGAIADAISAGLELVVPQSIDPFHEFAHFVRPYASTTDLAQIVLTLVLDWKSPQLDFGDFKASNVLTEFFSCFDEPWTVDIETCSGTAE